MIPDLVDEEESNGAFRNRTAHIFQSADANKEILDFCHIYWSSLILLDLLRESSVAEKEMIPD